MAHHATMDDPMMHHRSHDPSAGVIPVPHGPETGDETEEYPPEMSGPGGAPGGGYTPEQERRIFAYLTHPSDSYTPEGVYWADLPVWKRVKFVLATDAAETAKEWNATCRMFVKDPLSPLTWYLRNAVLPGAGLLLEGYVLFSIGNLGPLFSATWPECWKNFEVCNKIWTQTVTYLEVVGIMVGQVVVGIIGDWIGRRWGLIQDAAIMFLALLMISASWGRSLNGWVICYAWSLFVYGTGVGGEYPITATSSMENAVGAGKVSTREDRMHRGRKVTMAFLMQGWGQLLNQGLLIILLLVTHHGDGDPPYGHGTTQWTFRLSFVFPAIGTLWLVYYRVYKMPNASRQLTLAKRKANVTGYDVQSFKLTLIHFGGRLIATAGGWFCNDVFFYGNKLFQSQFIAVIASNPKSVMTGWLWNLCNVVVSLAGYYFASFFIDNKLYGRKWMQQIGFLLCFIMFVVPAFHYKYYTSPEHVHAFQAMYFLSSFFNQFGPNCVTFLVAGEVFPTPVRASAHGFSAMVGKAGALWITVLYNYIDTQTRFYVVPWFGLAGMLITWLWLPDTTGLDLKEQERRWDYIRRGRGKDYHGIAVHPQHLSVWERLMGIGRQYDADLDFKSRVDDIRADWHAKEAAKTVGDGQPDLDEDSEFSADVHNYFRKTGQSGSSGSDDSIAEEKEKEKEKDKETNPTA